MEPGRRSGRMASMVMLLRVEVTRWVADEPQPGTVRLRFVDIFGKRHAFTEKCAIVDDRDRLTRSAKYPIDANVACRVHGRVQIPV